MRTFIALVVLSMTAIMAAPAAQQYCTSGQCDGSTCVVNPVQLESDYLLACNGPACAPRPGFGQDVTAMPVAGQTYTVNSTSNATPASPVIYSSATNATPVYTYQNGSYQTSSPVYTSGQPTTYYPANTSCNTVSNCNTASSCGNVVYSQSRRPMRRGFVRRFFSRNNCSQSCGQVVYSQPVSQPAYTQSACTQPAYAQTAYNQPVYSQPVYSQTASYAQPVYAQQSYPQTVYSQSCNTCGQSCNQPVAGQTVYSQTTNGQPVYGQPVITGTPVMPVVDSANSTTTSSPAIDSEKAKLPEMPAAKEIADPSNEKVADPSDNSYAMSSRIGTVSTVYQRPPMTQTSYVSTAGVAQQKANNAAQMGVRGHVGGSLGGAKFEGVGWSNVSAQHAIQNCCYWGKRTPAQIGVSQGRDGFWYACVLYN